MAAAAVHRLRLRARHDDDVRRGAILLADALHVATLPEARSSRHYVVRHFDVGPFDRDAGPQTLALAIERRLAAVIAHAVPAESPGAAGAPAVWFANRPSAIAALAERLATGRVASEWFWRSLADGASRCSNGVASLAACLDAAAAESGAPRALACVVDRAERARPGAILGALTESEADGLLVRAFGVHADVAVTRNRTAAGERAVDSLAVLAALSPVWRARVATWLPRWSADARGVWLVALALVGSGVALSSPDAIVRRARELIDTGPAGVFAFEATPAADTRSASAGPSSAIAAMAQRADVIPSSPSEPSNAHAEAPAKARSGNVSFAAEVLRPAPRVEPARASTSTSRPSRERATPLTADGETAVGGLLFLLRPLTLLGLPAWIDRHASAAEAAFAARLLLGIAREQGALDDDPLVLALAEDAAAQDTARDDPRARRVWTRVAERWLARNTALRLRALVCRPARVACTPTHVDVCFLLRDADIHVRLAGLDMDPGWVPWLGRVVRFHYLDGRRA